MWPEQPAYPNIDSMGLGDFPVPDIPEIEVCPGDRHNLVPIKRYMKIFSFPNKHGAMMTGQETYWINQCVACGIEQTFAEL